MNVLFLFFLLCDFTVLLLLASLFTGSKFGWRTERKMCLRGSLLQQAVCSMDFHEEEWELVIWLVQVNTEWHRFIHTYKRKKTVSMCCSVHWLTLCVCMSVYVLRCIRVFVGWSIDSTWPTLGAGTTTSSCLASVRLLHSCSSLLPLLYSLSQSRTGRHEWSGGKGEFEE